MGKATSARTIAPAIKGSGKELTGKATHAKGSSEIAEGRVEGDRVSLVREL